MLNILQMRIFRKLTIDLSKLSKSSKICPQRKCSHKLKSILNLLLGSLTPVMDKNMKSSTMVKISKLVSNKKKIMSVKSRESVSMKQFSKSTESKRACKK